MIRLKKGKRASFLKGKIGVIDSGLGGLTVAKAIIEAFPKEEIIYAADTKRCPYGNRSVEEITQYVWEMIDFLMQKPLKALVIACNTVTALMLEDLQERLAIPVFGVIEPASMEAINQTKTKKIALIATTTTIKTKAYEKTIQSLDKTAIVHALACPLFVPMIEQGLTQTEVIQASLAPLVSKDFDTLIMGCTHFPLIAREIQEVVGEKVTLVDSTKQIIHKLEPIVEKQTHRQVTVHEFYVTGDRTSFQAKASAWLGFNVIAQSMTPNQALKNLS